MNVYFASDFHLGVPDHDVSLGREKLLVRWLDQIAGDASEIYLMGDVFDFWFEYRTVVPKGYVRLLGKLAELTGRGIKIHLYRGNHDIWAFDYLESEAGLILHRHPEVVRLQNHTFYLAHGDGLGKGDNGYKFLKKVFENPVNQWLFRWLHPDIGSRMALYFSRKSRIANIAKENSLPREQKPDSVSLERLLDYARQHCESDEGADYYIFGHRHVPAILPLSGSCTYVNLGDWVTWFSFAVYDGSGLSLFTYKNGIAEPLNL